MQDKRPLAFMNQTLSKRHRGLSTYEKKLIALLMEVERLRHYLHPHYFIIKTDHFGLKVLHNQKISTSLKHKGLIKLMRISNDIRYKKGVENIVADALSRRCDQQQPNNCHVITRLQPKQIEEVLANYEEDQDMMHAISNISTNPVANIDITMQQRMLRYKGKVWVGKHGQLRQQLIQQYMPMVLVDILVSWKLI